MFVVLALNTKFLITSLVMVSRVVSQYARLHTHTHTRARVASSDGRKVPRLHELARVTHGLAPADRIQDAGGLLSTDHRSLVDKQYTVAACC